MKYLIYGLGNQGELYSGTKHNIGQKIIEHIIQMPGNKDKVNILKTKFGVKITDFKLDSNLNLIFSDGFMNNSGLGLFQYLQFYKIKKNDVKIIIIHDDSDQFIGNWKLLKGGGSSGHHGINSIHSELKSGGFDKSDIFRLKIGIREIGNRQKSETFVLSKLSKEEELIILSLGKKIIENINLLNLNFDKFQTIINSKQTL